jgi:IS605 OrfB family transposase
MIVHRPLKGKIKTCTITREGDHWYASFSVEIRRRGKADRPRLAATERLIVTDPCLGEQPPAAARKARRIDLDLRGKTSDQRRAICEAAAWDASKIATAHSVSLALEDLGFGRKKREMGQARERLRPHDPAYARMLSALPYAMLGTALTRRAARDGVAVACVNPAYTSLIGAVNWACRYGLTRHQGAAVAIARRAQGHSERVNYVYGSRRRRSARPSPEDEGRHVWRQWAGLHRERRAAARAARKALAHPSGRGLPRLDRTGETRWFCERVTPSRRRGSRLRQLHPSGRWRGAMSETTLWCVWYRFIKFEHENPGLQSGDEVKIP